VVAVSTAGVQAIFGVETESTGNAGSDSMQQPSAGNTIIDFCKQMLSTARYFFFVFFFILLRM